MLTSVITALLAGVAFSVPYAAPTTIPVASSTMPYTYGPRHATSPSTWEGRQSPVVAVPCSGARGTTVPSASSNPRPVYHTTPSSSSSGPSYALPTKSLSANPRRAFQATYSPVYAAESSGPFYVSPTKTPCPNSPRPRPVIIATTTTTTVPTTPPAMVSVVSTTTPPTVPVSAPVLHSPSPPVPTPRPGSAAMAEDGSTAGANGDNTVSVAADEKSGAASSNGEDASFAAAAPGAAIGLGTSLRAHLDATATPCSKSNPAATSYASTSYFAPSAAPTQPYDSQSRPYVSNMNGGVDIRRAPSPSPFNANGYDYGNQKSTTVSPRYPSSAPRQKSGYTPVNNRPGSGNAISYATKTPCPYFGASIEQSNAYSAVTVTPTQSSGVTHRPVVAPSMAPASPSTVVPLQASPSSFPVMAASPLPGSMAQSEDGSTVTAEGDNTVSIAADKNSGSAAANGEDASLAAAAPGLGVAIGTSTRAHETSPSSSPEIPTNCGGRITNGYVPVTPDGSNTTPVEYTVGSPEEYLPASNPEAGGITTVEYRGDAPAMKDTGKAGKKRMKQHRQRKASNSNAYTSGDSKWSNANNYESASGYDKNRVDSEVVTTEAAPTKTPCALSGGSSIAPTMAATETSSGNGSGAVRPPVVVAASPSPVAVPAIASPKPGSMAISENGSSVTAEGDTTVALAADKDSGAASANGKDGAVAGAMPGMALGVGSSR